MKNRVKKQQAKSKEYADQKKGAKWSIIKIGDQVRVKKPGFERKGDQKYSDPQRSIGKKGPATYQTEDGKVWNQKQLAFFPIKEKKQSIENLHTPEKLNTEQDFQTGGPNTEVSQGANRPDIETDLNIEPKVRSSRSTRVKKKPVWHKDYEF